MDGSSTVKLVAQNSEKAERDESKLNGETDLVRNATRRLKVTVGSSKVMQIVQNVTICEWRLSGNEER